VEGSLRSLLRQAQGQGLTECCGRPTQVSVRKARGRYDREALYAGNGAVEPTDEAITALEAEIQNYVGQNYPVEKVEVSTDSDLILHDPKDAPDE
jgi:hypothetical protein